MSASPSWLSTSAPAPAAAAPAPAVDPLSIESSTAATANGTDASEEKDLPSIILMMRLVNMGAAAALITVSVGVKNEYKASRLCFAGEESIRNKFDDCFNEKNSIVIVLYFFVLPLTILRLRPFIFPFYPN
jgi:hypothetical protein